MSAEPGHFIKARQVFLLRVGILPQYHPMTGSTHDGDTGQGHEVAFYNVPLMGPNRIGTVGEEMSFDGHVSYARIGGTAAGHQWKVYKSSSETLGSGDLVESGSGTTFDWTPEDDGIFRVELSLDNRKSDHSTDGARFVRVFPTIRDSDLTKSVQLSGTFSVESGGYELTIRYKPLDPGETTEVPNWARVVVEMRTFYSNGAPDMGDEYNYHADQWVSTGNPASASVFFNGVVLSDSLEEDPQSETITFKVVSPGFMLQKIPLRGYYGTVPASTDTGGVTLPVEFPLMFGDPTRSITIPDGTSINVVEYIRQSQEDFPVHQISAMHFTDPIYHILQQHTNYMQWWDVYLEQAPELNQFPYSTSDGDLWSQLRQFQDARLGVLFCNNKGVLYFSRDVRFQDDVWWNDNVPDMVMTFTRDNMADVQVTHTPYRVAQVQLSGVNDMAQPFFARFPEIPDTIGEIHKRSGLKVFDANTLALWAGRLYSLMNEPDDLTVTALGLNRMLDIQDVVGVQYTDRGGTRVL